MLKSLLIATMCLLSSYVFAGCGCSKCILEGKIAFTDKRYATFTEALELLNHKFFPTIVETGTLRDGRTNCEGDGCSTIIFAQWVRDHGGQFTSIDKDPHAIKMAQQGLRDLKNYVQFECDDSLVVLHNFRHRIDFLYLDSFDFEMKNPLPSQNHHLNEIIAAYPFLAEDCVVMIDDCDLPHGGKGKLVISYLLERGWRIHSQGYQVILTRK